MLSALRYCIPFWNPHKPDQSNDGSSKATKTYDLEGHPEMEERPGDKIHVSSGAVKGEANLETLAKGSEHESFDVVFIHGLAGSSKTWVASDGTFWPKDLLPKALPAARVLSFSYASNIDGLVSSDSRFPSRVLLDKLVEFREQTKTLDRPIVFVGHSLGGLVIKHALFLAATATQGDWLRIASQTRGIVFFGTPHAGSSAAGLANVLEKTARLQFSGTNLSALLQMNSAIDNLLADQKWFLRYLRTREDIKIWCFYESRRDEEDTIVPKAAAILPPYEICAVDAAHQDMCKFSSATDTSFLNFCEVLRKWHSAWFPSRSSTPDMMPRSETENTMTASSVEAIPQSHAEQSLEDDVLELLRRRRSKEAELLQEQVAESTKLRFGPEHPSSISQTLLLIEIYNIRGRWRGAEPSIRDALRKSNKTLGPTSLVSIMARFCLAQTDLLSCHFDEARQNFSDVAQDCSGIGHDPRLASLLENASRLSNVLYKWHEAKEGPARIISMQEEIVGSMGHEPGHDEVALLGCQSTLNMMRIRHHNTDTGGYADAQQDVVRKMSSLRGDGDTQVLLHTGAFAIALVAQGKMHEALSVQEDVTFALRDRLGPDHPYCLAMLHNLALVANGTGDFDRAQALLQRTAKSLSRSLGEKHRFSTRCSQASGALAGLEGQGVLEFLLCPTLDFASYVEFIILSARSSRIVSMFW